MTNHVLFRIENEVYAVDILQAGSIEKNVKYTEVSGMPNCMKGIMQLRGDYIPVISIREKFKINEPKTDQAYEMIISSVRGINFAFLVDGVDNIIAMDFVEAKTIPLLKTNSASYIKRVANHDGQIVVVLDLSEIISDEDFAIIKEMLKGKKDAEVARQAEELKRATAKKAEEEAAAAEKA